MFNAYSPPMAMWPHEATALTNAEKKAYRNLLAANTNSHPQSRHAIQILVWAWVAVVCGCSDSNLLKRHIGEPLPASLQVVKRGIIDSKDPVYVFQATCSKDDLSAMLKTGFVEGDDSEKQYTVRLVEEGLHVSVPPASANVYLRSGVGTRVRVLSSTGENIFIVIATGLASR